MSHVSFRWQTRHASPPGEAAPACSDALRVQGLEVKEGRFGSHMRVRLANDGPVTIILDTDELGV